jgi:ArsR family transcriptional regulator
MKRDKAAEVFAQLGNPARLEVLRVLIRAGYGGCQVGELQKRVGVPASTLAFHLRGLVAAGLVDQEKQGRVVRCRPRLDTVNGAIEFLKQECCLGLGEPVQGRSKAA